VLRRCPERSEDSAAPLSGHLAVTWWRRRRRRRLVLDLGKRRVDGLDLLRHVAAVGVDAARGECHGRGAEMDLRRAPDALRREAAVIEARPRFRPVRRVAVAPSRQTGASPGFSEILPAPAAIFVRIGQELPSSVVATPRPFALGRRPRVGFHRPLT